GGMYANAITLVGTDKGLGVNLPPEVLASSGNISISSDGMINLQAVSAGGSVNVHSAASNITATKSVYAGATASLSAGGSVNVNAGSAVAAKNTISINANQLTNAGTIIAGLNADKTQNTTGLMNIATPNISNTGNIQSTGDLNATGTTFTNNGIVSAGHNLTMTSTNLTNNKTLFAGNNMNLYTSGTLSNTANSNIFAVNNLNLSANAAGGKSASIINDQATIQALNGTLNVNTLNLQNITTAPVIKTTTSTVGNTTTSIDSIQSQGTPAQLLSGGNMNLNADTLLNNYSLISSGGNINVTSNALTNQFLNLYKKVVVTTYKSVQQCKWFIGGWTGVKKCSTISVPQVTTTNSVIGNVASTIQASGNITGNVANLTSTGIHPNQVINATPTAFQQKLPAGNQLAIVLPAGTQGLFVVSPNPQSKFLVVTNPAFASYANFVGSSYLLNRLGYKPGLGT
ncbi:hypothetical protein D6779_09075, partial [Candidatus Parcubacteria bacterium]